jgi:acyl transferase domain-containing protein
MVKEKSAVEALEEAGIKRKKLPNVAIFMGKTKNSKSKSEKQEKKEKK